MRLDLGICIPLLGEDRKRNKNKKEVAGRSEERIVEFFVSPKLCIQM